jgi:thioredoxin reductase
MLFDVVIVGGGPAGLSAALNLGRARKRALLCDDGPRRNAVAELIRGFVTQDGTPPAEFRRIGREQLARYPNVEARDVRVEEIRGERGAFDVRLATGDRLQARRILLCTGMLDELPDIEGFRALWGRSIFQCPYCHGWEAQNLSFGFLAPTVEALEFALLLRGWSKDVVVLTDAQYAVSPETQTRLAESGVNLEQRRITQLAAKDGRLERVHFESGAPLRLEVLFARPPQRQTSVVQSLELALDSAGFVRVDEQRCTSIPGIYAGGDLVTPMQSATFAASTGVHAAVMLNHELTTEWATTRARVETVE